MNSADLRLKCLELSVSRANEKTSLVDTLSMAAEFEDYVHHGYRMKFVSLDADDYDIMHRLKRHLSWALKDRDYAWQIETQGINSWDDAIRSLMAKFDIKIPDAK